MSNYLVTGGAGFIGSNLVEHLVSNDKDPHEVVVIDDLSTGSRDNVPCGIPVLTSPYIASLDTQKEADLSGVFHLGIPSSTPIYRADRKTVASAINDFIILLEFCKEKNLRLVYVSSSSLYNGNPVPWKEGMHLVPFDFYTEARLCCERLASVYFQHYGVQSVGLRLFSVYGPKEEAKGKYANLITQLLWAKRDNETFEIYGDGLQARDATYVQDAVDAFVLAMESDVECGIFNIGTGRNYTLNRLAKMVGTKVKYVDNPLTNYVGTTLADTTKAIKVLGFEAKVSVEEGIALLTRRLIGTA